MYKYDFWADFSLFQEKGYSTSLCSLFLDFESPIRLFPEERISFTFPKGKTFSFKTVNDFGVPVQASGLCFFIDDASHYVWRDESGLNVKSSVRTSPVLFPSKKDALVAFAFLSETYGFSYDPYAENDLIEK